MAELSRRLQAWCRAAPQGERRTVILRPRADVEPAEAARQAEAAGARVESAGPGGLVVALDAQALAAVAGLPWVLAVEEPRTLQLKRPGS